MMSSAADFNMDDGYTALQNPPRARPPAGKVGSARRPPLAAHHRRRRAAALAVVALIALLLGVIVGAGSRGSSTVQPAAAHSTGFVARIHTLAGSGAGSFAVAQHRAEDA